MGGGSLGLHIALDLFADEKDVTKLRMVKKGANLLPLR